MTLGLSVIIPCWNGRHLLEENLPSVEEAVNRLERPWEVIVVDDASTDGLAEFLQREHAEVRVIRHEHNQGFSAGIRSGVAAARYDILYFLNSDVQLEPDALRTILPHFADERVFAVASLDTARQPFTVPALTNHCGLLGVRYVKVPLPTQAMPLLFATGGHSAYHAGKFRALGGFDELFAPIYWEDIDCCARAYACGWHVLLEPASRVQHRPGSTMARRQPSRVLETYRAGHRWLFTLRYSPSLGPWSILMLIASHGCTSGAALVTGLRRISSIRRDPNAAVTAQTRCSVPTVKRRHAIPWTVAYLSATGTVKGGGEISLLTLLTGIDRRSIRPVLLCLSEGDLVDRAKALGVEVQIIPLPSTARGMLDGTLARLARWMLASEVDIVHANTAGRALLLPGLAAKMLGLCVVWHVRIADREPLVDRLSVALVDRLIVTSDFVASRFPRGRAVNKIRYIPNPVDLTQFHPDRDGTAWRARHNLSPDRICVGVFGRFDRWKRFDLALQAIVQARSREPRLHLVMVGDGPERDSLEQLADRLDVRGVISFVGWQTEPAEAMVAMDIILHPTSGEHFGRVFIEAMACGKPVVAARSGGAAEIVRHEETGFLVSPDDAAALADGVVRLARDVLLRASIGRAARQHAEQHYSVARSTESLLQLYREALEVTG